LSNNPSNPDDRDRAVERPARYTRRRVVGAAVVAALSSSAAGKWLAPPALAASRTLDVRSFGAKGDGVTDDTAAIQSALDAAGASGGQTVLFPAGTYKLTDTLFVDSNTSLVGVGATSVLLQTTVDRGTIYNRKWDDGTGNSNINVSSLTVDGGGVGGIGIAFAGVKGGSVKDVFVKRLTGYGIWLWASGEIIPGFQGLPTMNVTVSGCTVTDVIDVGIEMDASDTCTVTGNSISVRSGYAAISAWNGAANCVITNNTIIGEGSKPPATAFRVGPRADVTYARVTENIVFRGNVAKNVLHGCVVSGLRSGPKNITFADNKLTSWDAATGGVGVDLTICDQIVVQGNTLTNFHTPISIGNPVAHPGTPGLTQDVTIKGNTINGGGTSLIYLLRSGAITGNSFLRTGNTVLYLYGCQNLSVQRNLAVNCGTAASGIVSFVVLDDYSRKPCLRNTLSWNECRDSRKKGYLKDCVLLLGGSDRNVVTHNSAKRAAAGGHGAYAQRKRHNTFAANVNR
jgi:parallel beta-helix repeat protein